MRIGDHFAKLVCVSKTAFDHVLAHYHYFTEMPPSAEIDITVTLVDGFGVPFLDYEVKIEEKINKVFFNRADYLIEVEHDYRQAKIMFYNDLALKHALMNLYSSFIIHKGWGLLIHSSCVVENGYAHVFSGNSGAGKSTIAKLSRPRQILSDEATILKISDDAITVFNSPFRSEIRVEKKENPVPLRSIELLYQSLSNKKVSLRKSESLLELIDKVFYWSYKEEDTVKVFRLLQLLNNNVSISQLHFQKDDTFWELLTNEKIYSKTGF